MTTPPRPSSQQLAVEVPQIGKLTLVFDRQADRISHALWLEPRRTGEQASSELPPRLLIESVEGASDDIWPASPPLQSLSIESFVPGTSVALLVGMAGNSHWSASIEPCREPAGFLFDIACRTTATAEFLGSRYRIAAGGELVPRAQSEHTATINFGYTRLLVTAESAGEFPPPELSLAGPQLILQAAQSTHKTIRWKYRLTF